MAIIDDAVVEGDEILMVSLTNLDRTTVTTLDVPTTATVITITDNDTATLTLMPASLTVTEGDGTATFTASLDNAVQGGFTVAASTTTDGTATDGIATVDEDYTALSDQMLTFSGSPNEIKTFTVTIIDDTGTDAEENPETLTVSLDNLGGTTLSVGGLPATATVTIIDNDNIALLTIDDVTVNEGDGTATVIVRLDPAVASGFTVDASTTDGTATVAGQDYTAVTDQSLTFSNTDITQTFTVDIMDDTVAEGAETLMVSLRNLQGTAVAVGLPVAATITITDNDLSFEGVSIIDRTYSTTSSVFLTLPEAIGGSGTLNYTLTPDITGLSFIFTPGTRVLAGTSTPIRGHRYYCADLHRHR